MGNARKKIARSKKVIYGLFVLILLATGVYISHRNLSTQNDFHITRADLLNKKITGYGETSSMLGILLDSGELPFVIRAEDEPSIPISKGTGTWSVENNKLLIKGVGGNNGLKELIPLVSSTGIPYLGEPELRYPGGIGITVSDEFFPKRKADVENDLYFNKFRLHAPTPIPSTKQAQGIKETELIGSWQIPNWDPADPECKHTKPDETCFPYDSEEISFSIENGVHVYNSYIHSHSLYTDCLWNIDRNLLTITCNNNAMIQSYNVLSVDNNELTLVDKNSGDKIIWEKV